MDHLDEATDYGDPAFAFNDDELVELELFHNGETDALVDQGLIISTG